MSWARDMAFYVALNLTAICYPLLILGLKLIINEYFHSLLLFSQSAGFQSNALDQWHNFDAIYIMSI